MRAASFDSATSLDKGHGRIERRTIETTTWLNGYLDWPDVGQVFRLRRSRKIKGKETVEEVFGITSLPREKCSAKRLLQLVRSHWGIENRLFGTRDVTLKEDASRVRTGDAAENLATIRNLVLALLSKLTKTGYTAAIRQFGFHPRKAIDLVIKRGRE